MNKDEMKRIIEDFLNKTKIYWGIPNNDIVCLNKK